MAIKHIRNLATILFLLASLAFVVAPQAIAQQLEIVEIGEGALDNDRLNGTPRWVRVNFNSINTGEHTIKVSWDSDADIRFSIFQDADTPIRIASVAATPSPSEWVGNLEAEESYYLGIWSVSGAANFTATVSVVIDEIIDDEPTTGSPVNAGVLDSDRVLGPRFRRFQVDSLATATHTIRVDFEELTNTSSDVRMNVFSPDGTRIGTSRNTENAVVWTGELTSNTRYSVSLWTVSGAVNYTASIDADLALALATQPIDQTVTEGQQASFTVEATGGGTLSYQWFVNGSRIVGETSDSITVFSTLLAENGDEYSVEVSNGVDKIVSDIAVLTVSEAFSLGQFSLEAARTWVLDGPATTVDYRVTATSHGWGQALLKVGDVMLVGGDFTGIQPTRNGPVIDRPYMTAFDSVSGEPVSSFLISDEVNDVVRTLTLSADGEQVYIGGDFGLVVVDAQTGEFEFNVDVSSGQLPGRIFAVEATSSHIYMGGDFLEVNGESRTNIARLNLAGDVDNVWSPTVTQGVHAGRSAPVQSLAVSPSEDIVYVGGTFRFINDTPVELSIQNRRISLLTVSALDGSVRPERFEPEITYDEPKGLIAHEIVVTENYVIVAWGGPNYLTFHSLTGERLNQYIGPGDIQTLQIVDDRVFVGHHGEFLSTLDNPIPPEAVVSIEPAIFRPFKVSSFRIDDGSFLPEQSWELSGRFGVWGISASEDGLWLAGNLRRAGTSGRNVEGVVRFPLR